MKYIECINFLYGLQPIGIKFGLSNTQKLLSALGSPHNKLKCIHVAGTNGKGSTCAMISSILKHAGYKTALYTSPHLVDISERIQINGIPISPPELIECVQAIRETIEKIGFKDSYPTYFEVVTVLAFYYFASQEVDFAVLETGMGGRLDATNVIIKPLITIITNIELEHKTYLGDTIEKIAFEKAGIIKPSCPIICGEKKSGAYSVIRKKAEEENAPLFWIPELYEYSIVNRSPEEYSLTIMRKHKSLPLIRLPLLGDYQINNLLLSVECIHLLNTLMKYEIADDQIQQGLMHTHWPGRMHIIKRDPYIILDGAHNPKAAQELAQSIPKFFSYKKLILVLGILKDKDIMGICQSLLPIADHLIVTAPKFERAANPETILDVIRENYAVLPHTMLYHDLLNAIDKARSIASFKDLILITGSLYVVGEALEIIDAQQDS